MDSTWSRMRWWYRAIVIPLAAIGLVDFLLKGWIWRSVARGDHGRVEVVAHVALFVLCFVVASFPWRGTWRGRELSRRSHALLMAFFALVMTLVLAATRVHRTAELLAVQRFLGYLAAGGGGVAAGTLLGSVVCKRRRSATGARLEDDG